MALPPKVFVSLACAVFFGATAYVRERITACGDAVRDAGIAQE